MSIELAQRIEDAIGRLWAGSGRLSSRCGGNSGGGFIFSCTAMGVDAKVANFVEPRLCRSVDKFDRVPRGPQRQYARALWLTWLAHLAEEGVLDERGLK